MKTILKLLKKYDKIVVRKSKITIYSDGTGHVSSIFGKEFYFNNMNELKQKLKQAILSVSNER